ncbi:MAG: glutamate synthase subunit beta, partial [Candidatus Margulisiibacteriota bacterium]
DYKEVFKPRTEAQVRSQAARCMDCGTPFCHWGCPIGNYIPEWNDYVNNRQWDKAFEILDASNPLPEITGRVCPALCEYACVLGINDDPVTIRENELAIIEHAFKHGLIRPRPPRRRTGQSVAIIGSGPAGLACAILLNRRGHAVAVFERDAKIGGMLRYGIPDFKLDKAIVDRRIELLKQEGIEFITRVAVKEDKATAGDMAVRSLIQKYNAVCLATGARTPRDLKIPGRELSGVHFAMEFLTQANQIAAGEKISKDKLINAKSKRVVVIGGGDTGSDCVGVANRLGAKSIAQLEVLPKPPAARSAQFPWPKYPVIFKTSSSHEEGCSRQWSVSAKEFIGESGPVNKIACVRLDLQMHEIPNSAFEIDADLVIIAAGFLRPEPINPAPGIFVAGDARRGPSLVVWAIWEGMQTAAEIDQFLRIKK